MELFVLAGTFIEELFSPIPSFVVLVPAGAAAQTLERGVLYLLILVVLSAIGRIAGAVILYWLTDKFEDRLLANGRRLFGISHAQIEQFGQRLGKKRRHEWTALFLMNAIPIFPAAALSICCGFLKVRFVVFVVCTFFGSMISAFVYLLIGYGGLQLAEAAPRIELASQLLLALLLAAVVVWLVGRKRKVTKRP